MSEKSIAIEDILDLRVPADVRISPDGQTLVWVERRVDQDRRALSQLMLAREGREARPLTQGAWVDRSPRWSPDGSRVAFLRTAPGDDESVETRLCVIRLDGGEARTVVSERGAFGAPAWAPDGGTLAVSFRQADEQPDDDDDGPLSIRVTRLGYKHDGQGYLPKDRFHLYRVDVDADEPQLDALTRGDWDDTEPAWSPDGTRLAFLSNRRPERHRDLENGDVFVLDVGGGDPVRCTHRRGTAAAPAWGPGGDWLVAPLCPAPPGQPLFRRNVELYRIDANGASEEVCLTADLDRCVMNLTIDDLWGLDHWSAVPAVSADGRRALMPIADQGTTWLAAVPCDPESDTTALDRIVDDRVVVCYDVAPESGRVAMITTSPTEPGRVEVCDVDGENRSVWAWPLQSYCDERTIIGPVELWVDTPDGSRVQTWVLLPEGEGPFPLLLEIHGGPVVQFGASFFHELQAFAALGYAVAYANPRGSQGYGEAFVSAIHQDWGGPPFVDLMAVVDRVVADYPIDAGRLGVMGGSYGGYMTTWMIAHTDRFAAACIQRTVSSMEAMIWSDFGFMFGDELEAFFWEDPELYRRMSPITYAGEIDTPVLICQGLADQRTPADQGERLFVMLKLLGKDVELVLFPGGTHDLSRSGTPKQRIERLRVIRQWFQERL